jgi:hypothetical protein
MHAKYIVCVRLCVSVCSFIILKMLNPCHTRAAFSRRPKKIQIAVVSEVGSQTSPQHRHSIVVAPHRTPTDCEHFEHDQNKRRHSAQWDRSKDAATTTQ